MYRVHKEVASGGGGRVTEIKCKACSNCSFCEGNGSPNRYYCEVATTECSPRRLICKTERHSREFTIKRTPRWCPAKEV